MTVGCPCPDCGQRFSIPVSGVTVVCIGTFSQYRFVCPQCHRTQLTSLEAHLAGTLLANGCPFESYAPVEFVPAGVQDRPITHDEMLDFLVDLRRQDILEELT